MKGKLFVVSFIVGALVFGGLMAFNAPAAAAQVAEVGRAEDRWQPYNVSPLFYVSIPIERVYMYRMGYVVVYRRGFFEMGRLHLPFDWFQRTDRNDRIIKLDTPGAWPHVSVFFRDGEFYKVRIHLARSFAHPTWGHMPQGINLSGHFEGVETLDISR